MNKGFSFVNINVEDRNLEYYAREARAGFENALQKNFWNGLARLLFGSRNQLLAFDEILERIPFEGQHDGGVQEIPVDRIVGSVGRSQDFDVDFLPRKSNIRRRWVNIARANLIGEYLPAIEVFQVGAVYFVKDGHHRVSVARVMHQAVIEAHVVVISIPAELAAQSDLEIAARRYEREQFFLHTRLIALRPEAQIQPTLPGFYHKMLDHISTHRWFMGVERGSNVEWEEAVLDWYDHVYQPVAQIIQAHHLLTAFPGRSVADLYLWISEHNWFLSKEFGQQVSYEDTALTFAERSAGELPRLLWRMLDRG